MKSKSKGLTPSCKKAGYLAVSKIPSPSCELRVWHFQIWLVTELNWLDSVGT